MPHAVPPLPYASDAFEPTIDELTMRLHHEKHHGSYVAGLNAALEGTAWADRPVGELLADLEALPQDKRAPVRNHSGGHVNHSLFRETLAPNDHGRPTGPLGEAIEARFGPCASSSGRSALPARSASAATGRGSFTTATASR